MSVLRIISRTYGIPRATERETFDVCQHDQVVKRKCVTTHAPEVVAAGDIIVMNGSYGDVGGSGNTGVRMVREAYIKYRRQQGTTHFFGY